MWNYNFERDFENCTLYIYIKHATNPYMLDEKIKIQFKKIKERKCKKIHKTFQF